MNEKEAHFLKKVNEIGSKYSSKDWHSLTIPTARKAIIPSVNVCKQTLIKSTSKKDCSVSWWENIYD